MKRKLDQIIKGSLSAARKLYKGTEIKELLNQPESDWPVEWKRIYFKSYPRLEQIKLKIIPNKSELQDSLSKVLLSRISDRNFSTRKITKKEISKLLFFTAGIKTKTDDWDSTTRTYPSAGARYPLEVYLAILNAQDLEKGLYHYNVKNHSLELLLKGQLSGQLHKAIKQDFIKKASFVLIITSVLGRSEIKYGNRAYRHCLLEAGHLAQNLYLVSTATSLKCCAIGGFVDHEINSLLDLNEENEFAIYILAVGK